MTVLELLVVLAVVAVVLAIALPQLIASFRASRESAAIGNLKAIANAEMTLYADHARFGVIAELFEDGLLAANQFGRGAEGGGAQGGGSEAISDGTYTYSIRFTRDAEGITIDADPLRANTKTYRRFRYRLGRRTAGGAAGSEGLLLVAQPSEASPPPGAYKPFK